MDHALTFSLGILLIVFALPLATGCEQSPVTSNKTVWIVVVDLGSTGTRIKMYQFKFDNKKTKWMPIKSITQKLKGALSELSANNTKDRTKIMLAITKLTGIGKRIIGSNDIKDTPVFLYGTSGLRLLPSTRVNKLLDLLKKYIDRSPFDKSCNKSAMTRVTVISGDQEAEFGWLSINYLLSDNVFKQKSKNTVGFLDMGGGSTQIAFIPLGNTSTEASLRAVFAKSYSGFGFETSMMKMVGAFDDCESNVKCSANDTYESICFHPYLNTTFKFGPNFFFMKGKHISDTRRYNACIEQIKAVIKKYGMNDSKRVSEQLKNDKRMFFGVSGFYYYAVTIANDGNVASNSKDLQSKRCNGFRLTLDLIKKAGRHFCKNPAINSKNRDLLFACMRSVYVIVLLQDVYQFNDNSVFHMCKTLPVSEGENIKVGWSFGVAVQAVKVLTKCK